VIRRGTERDHSWLTALAAEVYEDLGDYGSIIPSWLEHTGVIGYVDECDGSARRGFTLLGYYEPALGAGYVADLLAIAVEPAHQRQGVGGRLLRHAIRVSEVAARDNPIAEMRLTVASTNRSGLALFEKHEFTVLDAFHGSYDGGQRAIRMTRPIAGARPLRAVNESQSAG
jgi:ribosomal protein S18 acetylase RimI-like enzyme